MPGRRMLAFAERDLGKISRSLTKNLVGLPKLPVLTLQRLQLVRNIRWNAGALTLVTLSLLHPLVQGLRHATNLLCDRHHSRPSRGMIPLMIENHPHRTVANFG